MAEKADTVKGAAGEKQLDTNDRGASARSESLYRDADLSRPENAPRTDKPANATGRPEDHAGAVLDMSTGQVIDKTSYRPAQSGSEAKTETEPAAESKAKKELIDPAKKLEMGGETLSSAVDLLKKNLYDKQSIEGILRSIPAENKKQFENIYEQSTGKKLRDELKNRRMESAIALLEAKEEKRNAAWLKENLDHLSHLPVRMNAEKQLIERSIRNDLRSMNNDERKALNDELKQSGKDLGQTIAESKLSKESKAISQLYIDKGSNLSAEDLVAIAKIGLDSRNPREQKLLIVKEAFAGDSAAAKAARNIFAGKNGEGDAALSRVFSGSDLKQTEDYLQFGKLQTPTFIDLQASKWADSDKAIELVMNLMSAEERQKFSAGEKLARAGTTESAGADDQTAIKYYNSVHSSLEKAASSYTSPSRWSSSNREKQVAIWEDIAAHGEETLIGRMAKAGNNYFANEPADITKPVREFTQTDWQLMQDPTYRDKVLSLVAGVDGKSDSSIFDQASADMARRELIRAFGQPDAEKAREATHHTLSDATADFPEAIAASRSHELSPCAMVFDALMHGKAADYKQLSEQERQLLASRVQYMPISQEQRAAASKMLSDLKAGKDVQPGLAEQLHFDKLSGASNATVIEHLLAAKQSLAVPADPQVELAARSAFSSNQSFERFGKPLLDGQGIRAEKLREYNWKTVLPSYDDGPYATDLSHIDQTNYYNQLKLIAPQERTTILAAAADLAGNPESQKYLDKVFNGLSADERNIAINVLKNPNQEMSLADKIKARSIGADYNQDQIVDQFRKLNPLEKLDLINNYAQKYGTFLPADLTRGADDGTKRMVELSLPMSSNDLFRATQDWARESGSGLYGNVASTEIALAQTQQQLRAGLLDKLPPAEREKARTEIEALFQKYVSGLRSNDQAKDIYAKDLADKIMTLALTVAAPGVGASLGRLALAAGVSIATRIAVQHAIKDGVKGNEVVEASLFGIADAASLGTFSAFKGVFSQSLERAALSRLKSDAKSEILAGFETFVTAKDGEKQLANRLAANGITNPEQKAKDLIADFKRSVEGTPTDSTNLAGQTARYKDTVSASVDGKNVQGTVLAIQKEVIDGQERMVAVLKLPAGTSRKAPRESLEIADLDPVTQSVKDSFGASANRRYLVDRQTGDVYLVNGKPAKPEFKEGLVTVEAATADIRVLSRPDVLADSIAENANVIRNGISKGEAISAFKEAPERPWTGKVLPTKDLAPVFNPDRLDWNCTAAVSAVLRSLRSGKLTTARDVVNLKNAEGEILGAPLPGRFKPADSTPSDKWLEVATEKAYNYIENASGTKIERAELRLADLKEGADYVGLIDIPTGEEGTLQHIVYARKLGPKEVLVYDPQSGVRWSQSSLESPGTSVKFHKVSFQDDPSYK